MSARVTDQPSETDTIREIVRSEIARLHTSIPAVVLSYDRTTQRATVQPVVRFSRRDAETGERVTYQAPPIANCPVAWPSSGSASLTWDLANGDPCVLVFSERSLDEWLTTGEIDNEPADPRRHHLSDAVVFPGARSFADALPAAAYAAGATVLRGADIRLGSSAASDAVALSSLVSGALSTLKTAITATVVVAGDGGASFKATLLAALSSWPPSLGASKVKAE